MSHRSWNALFLSPVSVCLSSSAAERHQSEAEGFAAAEAGGPATGVHHRPFHTCHPASVLHPGRPAGLWGIREPSLRLGPGIRLLHPGGAQLYDRGMNVTIPWLPCGLCSPLPLQAVTVHCNQYYLAAKTMNYVSVKVLEARGKSLRMLLPVGSCCGRGKAHYALNVYILYVYVHFSWLAEGVLKAREVVLSDIYQLKAPKSIFDIQNQSHRAQ